MSWWKFTTIRQFSECMYDGNSIQLCTTHCDSWLFSIDIYLCMMVTAYSFVQHTVTHDYSVLTSIMKFNWKQTKTHSELVLLWTQLTKIHEYPPLPTSVQPISITKTLLIVLTKNEWDPPLFTGKLLIKFQNILRNTTQVIIRHRVKILFSIISSPITLERQKWKSSKKKGILLSSPVSSW
jgi:hypothetical protein